ncbi:aminotransferase class I/II-fold pyridoxal phosphate-dependent enzyme [Bradyrhizobium sp. NBAIM20]|nr:aminotransferase class I/II-fold pyridoxal phosphate-dependent enzyme [Bradyrhizobium sp. NBAIM20]MCA1460746.1 aminotransferase class I/II-fold pyridoxal phosphate-dependent enzyme [Bradyrhizobium sp. NBAIM18]
MPGDQYVVTGSAAIGGRFIDLGNDEIVQPLLSAREKTMEPVNLRPSGYFDPTGLMPLRKAVAKRLAAQTGIEWTAEEIVITAGSNKALLYAALAVLKGGDEVIIIRPWQPEVTPLILALGAVPVFVDAQRPRYTPDVSSIRAAVTPRTRAIIIIPLTIRLAQSTTEQHCTISASSLSNSGYGSFRMSATLVSYSLVSIATNRSSPSTLAYGRGQSSSIHVQSA